MKLFFLIIMFYINVFAYDFSVWDLNNLNVKKILNTSAPYKQFLNGYFLKKDFHIIFGINNKNIFKYLSHQFDYKFIYNKKTNIAIVGDPFIIEDISLSFYPDKNNIWENKPLMIYFPLFNLNVIAIKTTKDYLFKELSDLKNVLKYYKNKGYLNIIIVGNFNADVMDISNLSKILEKYIYINKIKTKINYNHHLNRNLNVISTNKLKVKIDKAIIEKSIMGDKDFKQLSKYYPIYIEN